MNNLACEQHLVNSFLEPLSSWNPGYSSPWIKGQRWTFFSHDTRGNSQSSFFLSRIVSLKYVYRKWRKKLCIHTHMHPCSDLNNEIPRLKNCYVLYFICMYIECSFCRLIRRPGSFLESLIGRANWRSTIWWSLDQCSLAPPSVTETSCYCALFCVFMARVRYSLEQRVFIYDCYVKTDSYKTCRRTFHHKFPDTTCPSGDTVSKLVKKVRTHCILIDSR
jgi:hypothetical protein